jgi:hypothetical protein
MIWKLVISVCIAVIARPLVYDNVVYLIVCLLMAGVVIMLGEILEKIKRP